MWSWASTWYIWNNEYTVIKIWKPQIEKNFKGRLGSGGKDNMLNNLGLTLNSEGRVKDGPDFEQRARLKMGQVSGKKLSGLHAAEVNLN